MSNLWQQGMTRRDVLRAGAIGAGLGMAGKTLLAADAPAAAEKSDKKIPIAVQLYSLRQIIGKDVPGTLAAVGKMGYQGVEFAGYYGLEKNPKELRKILDDAGLKCCGTHTGLGTLEGDNLKKTVELHQALGNKFLIVPSMSAKTANGWLELAKKFNEISAKAREQGMYIGYHAHAHDLKPIEGKTPWELFFDNTNVDVCHQMDTGNCLSGGGDPVAMIKKYAKRTRTIHLKAHGGAGDAPIGEDKVDWKGVFEACETVGGTEWYIVEHESGKNPMESIKACIDNLHKMGK